MLEGGWADGCSEKIPGDQSDVVEVGLLFSYLLPVDEYSESFSEASCWKSQCEFPVFYSIRYKITMHILRRTFEPGLLISREKDR